MNININIIPILLGKTSQQINKQPFNILIFFLNSQLQSSHAKTAQRTAPSKSQPTKSSLHSSVSSTITSNLSSNTQNSLSIHSSSPPSSVPSLSYHIPSLSTITTPSTLEMDEDYDNI